MRSAKFLQMYFKLSQRNLSNYLSKSNQSHASWYYVFSFTVQVAPVTPNLNTTGTRGSNKQLVNKQSTNSLTPTPNPAMSNDITYIFRDGNLS